MPDQPPLLQHQSGQIQRGPLQGCHFTIEHTGPRQDGWWTVRLEYQPGKYRLEAFSESMLRPKPEPVKR